MGKTKTQDVSSLLEYLSFFLLSFPPVAPFPVRSVQSGQIDYRLVWANLFLHTVSRVASVRWCFFPLFLVRPGRAEHPRKASEP